MKRSLAALVLLLSSFGATRAQSFRAGDYDGLRLGYDKSTNKLSGYFEGYGVIDEQTGYPKFSCVFYIEGNITGKTFKIISYYPDDSLTMLINGTVVLLDNGRLTVRLSDEHGGCWNVLQFKDEPVEFHLIKEYKWLGISYVVTDKTFFYKERSESARTRAYLVKNDLVCVNRIEDGWVHCSYYGKKPTSGWIRRQDLH